MRGVFIHKYPHSGAYVLVRGILRSLEPLILVLVVDRDLNLQPTVSIYNSVLKACVRGKNYSRALSTMTDLRKSGKRPEQETWELLVEACIVCGRWECAVEVVKDMYAEEVGICTFENETEQRETEQKALQYAPDERELGACRHLVYDMIYVPRYAVHFVNFNIFILHGDAKATTFGPASDILYV